MPTGDTANGRHLPCPWARWRRTRSLSFLNLPLFTYKGGTLEPLKLLRTLDAATHGDWNVWFRSPVNGDLIKGRLCAIRKSKRSHRACKKKLRIKASRQQQELRPELEHAEYVSLFTWQSFLSEGRGHFESVPRPLAD